MAVDNESTFKTGNKELNVIHDGEVVWLTFYEDNQCVRKEILNAELSRDRIESALIAHGVETAQ